MEEKDFDRIFEMLPVDAVVVGGCALMIWAEIFKLPFLTEDPQNPEKRITQDIDVYGTQNVLDYIDGKWTGRSRSISDLFDTNLLGQVISYSEDMRGYKKVDVLLGINKMDPVAFLKRTAKVPYKTYSVRVLHPLDLLKSRMENMNTVEGKQTQHHADQMRLTINIVATLIKETLKLYESNKNEALLVKTLEWLKEIGDYAIGPKLQGTAKAWDLDIVDAVPIKEIQETCGSDEITHFLQDVWPGILNKAGKIAPLATTNPKFIEKEKSKTKRKP